MICLSEIQDMYEVLFFMMKVVILSPTTPAVVAPVWIPIRIFSLKLGSWGSMMPAEKF